MSSFSSKSVILLTHAEEYILSHFWISSHDARTVNYLIVILKQNNVEEHESIFIHMEYLFDILRADIEKQVTRKIMFNLRDDVLSDSTYE